MRVETKLVLSVCCNTVVRHEVLGDAAGSWERPDWDAQTPAVLPRAGALLGLGLQAAQPSCRAAFCPLLLFESVLMLFFIERESFLSCKILLGGYSQTDRTFCGSGCWWRCCTPCSVLLVSCSGLSCLLGQLLILQVQPLHMCREDVTFSSGLFGGCLSLFKDLRRHSYSTLTHSRCLNLSVCTEEWMGSSRQMLQCRIGISVSGRAGERGALMGMRGW